MSLFTFEYTPLSHRETSQAGGIDRSGTGTKGDFVSWFSFFFFFLNLILFIFYTAGSY